MVSLKGYSCLQNKQIMQKKIEGTFLPGFDDIC